jgi:hypothetical protein
VIRSMGITHPAAILKGKAGMESPTRKALRRFAADLTSPGPTPPDPTQVVAPPNSNLFPTWQQIEAYLTDPLMYEGVVVDIENPNDTLKIVGWCRLADMASLVVWFVDSAGEEVWTHPERVLVHGLVREAWGNPRIPIYMHNGQQHDAPYMERYGFGPIGNYAGDSLLMLRHAFPEQSAGLQWAALQYVPGATPWKQWMKWDTDDTFNK